MNIFKCPFCGKKPETHYYNEEEGHDEFWITGCPDCDLFSGITAASKQISQNDWNALISRFPSIMRVRIDDKVEVRESSTLYHYFRVTEIDINAGIFMGTCLKTDKLEQFKFEEIVTWPWELEQEGGAEQ